MLRRLDLRTGCRTVTLSFRHLTGEPLGLPVFQVLNFNWKLRPSLAREFLSS
eukprot:COSAG02_NODE_45_length_45811_cov_83.565891_11_plen_52_part_00